jgi:signal transduction histidine kinase
MTENRPVDTLRAFLLADDDERRALERALHDGVQQELIAVAVNLQLLRGLVGVNPQEAADLLDDLRSMVGEALADLRGLAQRIHPPLLDTQGLAAALRMAAAHSPIPARLEGAVEGDVPPEVAVTVYRSSVAALAAAEGEAPRATIVVGTRNGVLELEIALTGGRIAAGALDPLACRFEALGGALETTPDRIAGRLPTTS